MVNVRKYCVLLTGVAIWWVITKPNIQLLQSFMVVDVILSRNLEVSFSRVVDMDKVLISFITPSL